MKKIFSKINMIRAGLLVGAVAIILLILPRPDLQSYSYEPNQPWKYPLLTAPFDMPILRDSASISGLRDSIDRAFVPFAKRQDTVSTANVARLRAMIAPYVSLSEAHELTSLLSEVYGNGVVEPDVYDIIHKQGHKTLRMADETPEVNAVATIDADAMLSPAAAFQFIDSAYLARHGLENRHVDQNVATALNACLTPNVVLDTASDKKYRYQEYLNVTAAQGIIKKGQRIVDRGEIVTPQIYTNLNTYQEMLAGQKQGEHPDTYYIIGQALYILIIFSALYLFMATYRPRFFSDIRKMTFLVSFVTLFVIFAVLMFEGFSNGLYFVPFAAVPVIILIFFDSRTAIFSLLATIMLSAMVATFPYNFIFMELSAGMAATFSINQLSKRSQLLRTALISFLVYALTYFCICLIADGNLQNFSWRLIGAFAVNAVILSFAYVLIFVIEKVFGFTSTVTLVELSDINNGLLRRLAEEAPGTFQHSMQVSTLAAEAARAVGANTQLVRTGALYHDIGKMNGPIFFTENQHGVNPHEGLDPETSAHKIISHVTDGLAMASKEKLPLVIRNFIAEHHGRGMAKYFYNTAVNNAPEGKTVDKTPFTYPGPNPQSKETTILMMADAVEAASRSLRDYSQKSIDALVDRIIDGQEADGLYHDSPISFKDIETVKNTFKKRLGTIYHARVAYPEIKKAPENVTTNNA